MARTLLASGGSVLILSLTACGGGGGGGVVSTPPLATAAPTPAPTPTPTPTPTPAPTTVAMTGTPTPRPAAGYDTREYRNSNAAVVSGALTAYNMGWTGQGVKIGIIDSGLRQTLNEFTGKIDSASRDVTGAGRPIDDVDGHGTAVASTAAGARNLESTQGVAPDSTLVIMRADDPDSCTNTTGEDPGCRFEDPAIATGVRAAADAGAKVINLSLGGGAPGSSVLSAFNYAVSKGVVIVISAGNDGDKPEGANADPFAAAPASQFPNNVIIAGSIGTFHDDTKTTDSLDTISPFSNRAGASANNVLMALGAGVHTANADATKVWLYSGTSFSAPTISGAVALLAQAYPNLTGAQIVKILFATADDLGAPGIDAIYGRGRLNITQAFQPIGTTTIAGSSVGVTSTGTAPPATGDGASGASIGAIILDGFSRAYSANLANGMRNAPQTSQLTQSLSGRVLAAGANAGPVSFVMTVAPRRDLRQGFALERSGIGPQDEQRARLLAGSMVARIDDRTAMALGFREGARGMARRLTGVPTNSFLIARDVIADAGFATDRGTAMAVRRSLGAFGLTMTSERGNVSRSLRPITLGDNPAPYSWTSMAVDRTVAGTLVTAGIGRLDERRSVLGGEFTAALGGASRAQTAFVDLEARREFGSGWSASASARFGWTRFGSSALRTNAFGLDLAKAGLISADDTLAVRVSQPLRAYGGGLNLLLPTSWNYDTMSAGFTQGTYSLTPTGREVDTELSYQRRVLGGKAWMGANLFARRDPGHIAAAAPDVGGALRFSLGF